jgi:steroid delta-isomerase-like uncharacterized protein
MVMHRVRALLSVVMLVLVGIMAPWTSSGVIGQQGTPDAKSIPPMLAAWAEAWSSGDPTQMAALYTEDGVYEEVPTGVVARGPDEITAFIADTYAAIPDARVTPRRGFQAEDWAVMEADFSGESAEGASFSIPFVVVFELEGDKIVRETDYFDLNALMTQLDASGAAATPAA